MSTSKPNEFQRSIDDIVADLKISKDAQGGSCCLLIGAGCSATAGIPTAAGFVEKIKEFHPPAYDRAVEKTYARCMAELFPAQQRDLIAGVVNDAKINWAHVCIALMMRHGYIDRVLTTNFDPLVTRACALLGIYPAIYDFASSTFLRRSYIPDKAVFHLHGQHTGFVLMNTETDLEEQSQRLGPLFEDAGSGRMWLVVGYSGENDPVFDHLAGVDEFDNGLYWVGYRDQNPPKHVQDKLLIPGKFAYYMNGYDADSFFIEVARRLEIFPPELISRPFSHLATIMETLTPFPRRRRRSEEDVTRVASTN